MQPEDPAALETFDAVPEVYEPQSRQGLLDDMEAFIKERSADRVVRPLVVALTTATLIP